MTVVQSTRMVGTVRGSVPAAALGPTHMHEHLLISQVPADGRSPGTTDAERGRWERPIRLDNLDDVRRHPHLYRANLVLDSVDEAIAELAPFVAAGGGCVVDATTPDLGRDPAGLRAISERAGVHVVMGCGRYTHRTHGPDVAGMSEAALAAEMIEDLTTGRDGVVAGIIGEIGLSWPVHPDEAKVLRAAVRAQRATGAAITIHPGRDPRAPQDALQRVVEAGGDPAGCIVGHLDGRLTGEDEFLAVARAGCYLEIDLFGLESSHFPAHPSMDLPNDAGRVRQLRLLIEHGFGERLLVSSDVAVKHHRRRYGGWGYAHVLEHAVPLMLERGLTRADVDRILVENPARALAGTS